MPDLSVCIIVKTSKIKDKNIRDDLNVNKDHCTSTYVSKVIRYQLFPYWECYSFHIMLALLINLKKQLHLTYMLHAAMEILLVTLFTNSNWHSLVVMFSLDPQFAILKSLSYSTGILGAGSTEFHVPIDLLVPFRQDTNAT